MTRQGTVTADVRAEQLLNVALRVAADVRDDLAAAHRTIRHLDRHDLEAVTVILAALVPVDTPVSELAWWQHTPAATS